MYVLTKTGIFESSPWYLESRVRGLKQTKRRGLSLFSHDTLKQSNKHNSSTKALHVAQSTSFSSRTLLPINKKENKTNSSVSMYISALFPQILQYGSLKYGTVWNGYYNTVGYFLNCTFFTDGNNIAPHKTM